MQFLRSITGRKNPATRGNSISNSMRKRAEQKEEAWHKYKIAENAFKEQNRLRDEAAAEKARTHTYKIVEIEEFNCNGYGHCDQREVVRMVTPEVGKIWEENKRKKEEKEKADSNALAARIAKDKEEFAASKLKFCRPIVERNLTKYSHPHVQRGGNNNTPFAPIYYRIDKKPNPACESMKFHGTSYNYTAPTCDPYFFYPKTEVSYDEYNKWIATINLKGLLKGNDNMLFSEIYKSIKLRKEAFEQHDPTSSEAEDTYSLFRKLEEIKDEYNKAEKASKERAEKEAQQRKDNKQFDYCQRDINNNPDAYRDLFEPVNQDPQAPQAGGIRRSKTRRYKKISKKSRRKGRCSRV